MEDDFETLYHRLMNPSIPSYEKELYKAMVMYSDETGDLLEHFLPFFQKTLLHKWWEMIKYQHTKERRMTARQRKERRVLIRHVYRLATCDTKVMRVLDLVVRQVRELDGMDV